MKALILSLALFTALPLHAQERRETPKLLTLAAVLPIGFDAASTIWVGTHVPPGYVGKELLLPSDNLAVITGVCAAQALLVDWGVKRLWRAHQKKWAVIMLVGVGSARTWAGVHNLRLEP